MNEFILETENLTKIYDKVKVVDSVDIKIPEGQIYGLLGKNGAGKTTTMCMLLNFYKKDEGLIKIFGKTVEELDNKVYEKVGSLIETPGFYPNLTGEENLKLFSKLYKIPTENIIKVLKLVSLTNEKDKLFKKYSLGMKQRLAIALALLKDPKLLILDEPINGLDPIGIQEIRTTLKKLAAEKNITILISSHILSEIEQLVDVIGVLDEGRLIEEISVEKLEKKLVKYVYIQVNDSKKTLKALTKWGLVENEDFTISENGEVKLYTHIDSRAEINRLLNDEKIDVFTVQIVKENLEDYFNHLIENKES